MTKTVSLSDIDQFIRIDVDKQDILRNSTTKDTRITFTCSKSTINQ